MAALACLTLAVPSFLWTLGDLILAHIDCGGFSLIRLVYNVLMDYVVMTIVIYIIQVRREGTIL